MRPEGGGFDGGFKYYAEWFSAHLGNHLIDPHTTVIIQQMLESVVKENQSDMVDYIGSG